MAAPPTERPKPPLHNFALPLNLKWGTQRILKCMKLPPTTAPDHTQSPLRPSRPSPPLHSDSFRTVRSSPNSAPSSSDGDKDKSAAAGLRPWNLRTRRAACKSPMRFPLKGVGSAVAARGEVIKKKKMMKRRRKFAVALTREEVEIDFAMIVGIRPPRRPKKRPRVLQNQLDSIFPGLWLTEVTVDTYKVPDVPE